MFLKNRKKKPGYMELNDLIFKLSRYDLTVVVLVMFCGGEMEEVEANEGKRKHHWTEMGSMMFESSFHAAWDTHGPT